MSKEKASIIYDGDCRFCIRQIERIQTMDSKQLFEYFPRQAPELNERFPALKEMDFEEGMRLVDSNGGIFVGADAVYQIARRLPRTRFVAWLYCLPGLKQIACFVYRLIAANRKRLGASCHNGLCKNVQPGEKAKW